MPWERPCRSSGTSSNKVLDMDIMLYFGSFNPIHRGHIAIAEWVLKQEMCDELWFIVSPQNPFKQADELISEEQRMEMVRIAIQESAYPERTKASGIEFELPKPSYTIDTLDVLRKQYPDYHFSLLIGEDNVNNLPLWKEYDRLTREYPIWYYPRRSSEQTSFNTPARLLPDAPFLEYASTEIRQKVRQGESIEQMVPSGVNRYIKEHKLWTCTNACKTK